MPTQVRFYSAPLICEADPQIGCGCRAKPVLARLDDQSDAARLVRHLSQWDAMLTPTTLLPAGAAQPLTGPEHP